MYVFLKIHCTILFSGDEILSVNDVELAGLSHAEAIQIFKRVRNGQIRLKIARRKNNFDKLVSNIKIN